MKLYGTENNEIIMKELGKRIQDTRISMNLTQSEMAEKSGVALRTVARIEKRVRKTKNGRGEMREYDHCGGVFVGNQDRCDGTGRSYLFSVSAT